MTKADSDTVYPGQVYWIPADQGGYDATTGWNPDVKLLDPALVPTLPSIESPKPEAGYDDDDWSRFELGWQTIAEHTQQVVDELNTVAQNQSLDDATRSALAVASRWHDWGKAHTIFQQAIKKPENRREQANLAKAPDGCWDRYTRKHFRHELASALGMLSLLRSGRAPADWASLSPHLQNLALYLIAAHHGKVRLSIRSMPDESKPTGQDQLFARGVWDGDELPPIALGDGVTAPHVKLDLSPMKLGRGADGSPSWAERMLLLRDHPDFGPLKLAYLEALLRAADMRASKKADEKAQVKHA